MNAPGVFVDLIVPFESTDNEIDPVFSCCEHVLLGEKSLDTALSGSA